LTRNRLKRKKQEENSWGLCTDMAKPKTPVQVIKEASKNKKLVLGTKTVLKGLKNTTINQVFCASNFPEQTRKDLNHYAGLSNVKIEEFGGNSSKLGEACGKPFKILIVGIQK